MPNRALERATASDDEAVRALLRRAPMDGDIRLTFEREPALALSASIEGDRQHLFVARDPDGRLSGLFSRSVRRAWVNGRQARIGYLGQFRAEVPVASARRQLKDGFSLCRGTHLDDELPFDYTSIMSDNVVARRLLERGLPGLPRYVPLAEYRTLVFSSMRRDAMSTAGVRSEAGSAVGFESIASFLSHQYENFQLAPVWTAEDLRSDEATRGLSIDDFVVAFRGDALVGCAALWNQAAYRQAVVRGYSRRLSALRPLANAWYRMRGEPRLPAVGERLRIATVSHFAVEDDDPAVSATLLTQVAAMARARGIEMLTLGLAQKRTLFASICDRLRARVLESILYAVHYEEIEQPVLDDRVAHVEVATL